MFWDFLPLTDAAAQVYDLLECLLSHIWFRDKGLWSDACKAGQDFILEILASAQPQQQPPGPAASCFKSHGAAVAWQFELVNLSSD